MQPVILIVLGTFLVGGLAVYVVQRKSQGSEKWESITGFKERQLWDYLKIVVIPFILAAIAVIFNAQQTETALTFSAQQKQTSLAIAGEQQRETILENYLDRMSNL